MHSMFSIGVILPNGLMKIVKLEGKNKNKNWRVFLAKF
jgi:hypothetical protein